MINLSRKVFPIFLVIFLTTTFCSPVVAKELTWKSIPITTIADIAASRAGGEGFQVVEDIVFSHSNPKVMYLSTNTSQVWKSIDSGKTWKSARGGFKSHGAASLAVDRGNSDIVFAAGTQGRNENFSHKLPNRFEGIYRTLDGGENWQLVKLTHFNTTSNKGDLILIMPMTKGQNYPVIYAGSFSEGLLKSIDLGESWVVVDKNLHSISDLSIDYETTGAIFIAAKEGLYTLNGGVLAEVGKSLPGRPLSITTSINKPQQIFVSTDSYGIYISSDSGKTFHYSNAHNAIVLESSPVNPNYVFAKRSQHNKRMPLYSHDAGKTWAYSELPDDLDPVFDRKSEQFWFSSPFATHPENPNIVFTVSNGKGRILKSIDAGKTWTYSGSGFTGGRMKDIAFLPDGRYLFAFTDRGIWESINDNLNSFEYLAVPRVFGARSVSAIAVEKNLVVAAIGNWGKKAIAVSKDFGKTWTINEETSANHDFVAIDPGDSKYIYAGNFISSDQGVSWNESDYFVEAIDNKGRLYALIQKGTKTIVVQSIDKGESWKPMAAAIPLSIKKINDVAVSNDTNPTIYLATNEGVYVIYSDKWQFKNENNGLLMDDYGELVVSGVVVDPGNRDVVYAARRSPGYGQSNGVFKSIDGGDSWVNITYNLGKYLTVWSIKINPISGNVLVGTSLGSFIL